ncbi:unnamed protein product [Heligmosomoides polygyrus]|uniref:Essential MCU regulator, mitochondrial n=1 Tax=Heligmosomoides polygyrus TaxID=6339 RepID=A0A183FY13_HELPZ|nr:unnamed protein product [Heligmosomoides polygyrus]
MAGQRLTPRVPTLDAWQSPASSACSQPLKAIPPSNPVAPIARLKSPAKPLSLLVLTFVASVSLGAMVAVQTAEWIQHYCIQDSLSGADDDD